MRKSILLLIFGLASFQTLSCDICGCANSGSFFGVLPQSHLRIFGFKMKYREFDSHINSVSQKTTEQYKSTEVWARLYPLPKLQVLASLPINYNTQIIKLTGEQKMQSGLGDASFLAQYNVKNTFWDSTHTSHFQHNILVGAGLKLPTGQFSYEVAKNDVLNPNFQLGTGSFDAILNANYTIRWHNIGLNTDLQYKLNGQNKNNYRFGKKVSSSTTVFYNVKMKDVQTVLQVGTFAEHAQNDKLNGIFNNDTGGWLVASYLGVDFYYRKLLLGGNFQKPLAQNLAKKQINAKPIISLNLAYLF